MRQEQAWRVESHNATQGWKFETTILGPTTAAGAVRAYRRLYKKDHPSVMGPWKFRATKASQNPGRKRKKKSPTKRISAALTRFLKKQNPGKMKGVTHVRVRKLKGGGITITPA